MSTATTERTPNSQNLGLGLNGWASPVPLGKLQRYRVVFKGLNVIVNAHGSYEARKLARVKFLAMYTDTTPDEALGSIDTFTEIARATVLGNR